MHGGVFSENTVYQFWPNTTNLSKRINNKKFLPNGEAEETLQPLFQTLVLYSFLFAASLCSFAVLTLAIPHSLVISLPEQTFQV